MVPQRELEVLEAQRSATTRAARGVPLIDYFGKITESETLATQFLPASSKG